MGSNLIQDRSFALWAPSIKVELLLMFLMLKQRLMKSDMNSSYKLWLILSKRCHLYRSYTLSTNIYGSNWSGFSVEPPSNSTEQQQTVELGNDFRSLKGAREEKLQILPSTYLREPFRLKLITEFYLLHSLSQYSCWLAHNCGIWTSSDKKYKCICLNPGWDDNRVYAPWMRRISVYEGKCTRDAQRLMFVLKSSFFQLEVKAPPA